MNDEEVTLEQLNKLCATKHDIFSSIQIPRRCTLPLDTIKVDVGKNGEMGQLVVGRNSIVHSKILNHFIKGKNSLSPMGTIVGILSELESIESLVKLVRKKHNERLKIVNLTKVEGS